MHEIMDTQRQGADIIQDALTHIARDTEDSIEYAHASATLRALHDLLTNRTVQRGIRALYHTTAERERRERDYVLGIQRAIALEEN